MSHTGSFAWNPVTRQILYWSEECFRIYGRDPAQGLPSLERVLADIHPEDVPWIMAKLEETLREGREWNTEYRLVNFAGGPRTVRCLAHPILDGAGRVLEYVGTVMDITEQKRAEEERREHLWFLESMDRINRAMQRTNDVEGMMSGVLEETLAIFGSDRAWLAYPCDPNAATSRVVMEHTRPEYPGAFALGEEFPVDMQQAELLRRVLEGPGAAADLCVPPEIRERFSIQSIIAIAVRPKGDRPYLFGLHQCSHARAWTAAERRLFEEIARRLEDALTSVLAHRNLLASEERYAHAMEGSDAGHWDWNIVTDEMFLSERARQMLVLPDGPLPRTRTAVMALAPQHPDDIVSWDQHIDDGIAKGRYEREYRVVPKPGEVRWIRARAKVYKDAHGAALRMTGSLADITEAKLAEDALRASEERYSLALDATEEGHFDVNIDMDEVLTSAPLNEIYGFPPGTHLVKRSECLKGFPFYGNDAEIYHAEIRAAEAKGGPERYEFEYRILRSSGEVRWLRTRGKVTRDAEGRARRRTGVVADITERKRAEDALRASEQRYSLAMDAADEGHYDLNLDSGELFISERLNGVYGFAPGTRFANRGEYLDMVRLYPEDADKYHADLAAAVADGGPERFEFGFRIVRPSGEVRWLWTRGKVTRDAEGRAHRRTGVVADVTDQKRAEEERRAHLWFLQSMDRINRAMQRSNDVEPMTSGVMQEALEIFACDRAALIYPCDPDAPTFRTVMEHTSPEYGGAVSLGLDLPASPEWVEVARRALHHPEAVVDPGVVSGRRERYHIASTLAIAVRPKGDRPYLFAVHSARSRPWTAAEVRLFEEIARRLEDALTSVLAHRNLLASQEELRTSEQRFRTFVDHATDAFYLYDDELVVRDVNRQACETTGYTREELIGMHVSQLSASATPEKIESQWRRLVEHGTETYNGLRRRKDGSVFPVEIRARTFNRGGRIFALAVAIDITERKRREQRLLAQFRVTQTLSEASSLEKAAPGILRAMCEALEWDLGALWQVDPEGGVLRCIATWPSASAAPPNFAAATRAISFGPGMGLPGRVWSSQAKERHRRRYRIIQPGDPRRRSRTAADDGRYRLPGRAVHRAHAGEGRAARRPGKAYASVQDCVARRAVRHHRS